MPLRRLFYAITAVLIAIAMVIAGLSAVPIRHRFSFQLSSQSLLAGVVQKTYPKGENVEFHWQTGDDREETFALYIDNSSVVYRAYSSGGDYTFKAVGGTYDYEVSSFLAENTTVSGSYATPIL